VAGGQPESGSPASPTTIAARTRADLSQFSRSERRVAQALLADYPNAALGTVAELAERAQVSAPSVVRFAHRLGLAGFAQLQGELRDELSRQTSGPLRRAPGQDRTDAPSTVLMRRARQQSDRALDCLGHIGVETLETVVGILADSNRRIYLAGGRFSRLLAAYLGMQLQEIRPRVSIIADPHGRDLDAVIGLRRGDVVVLFDFARYQRSAVELARTARQARATVLLITDDVACPAAVPADHVLVIASDSDLAFQSMSGAFLFTELIIGPVLDRLGEAGITRLARWERYRLAELI